MGNLVYNNTGYFVKYAVANLIRNRKEPQIVSIQETQAPMKTLEMAVRDVKTQYGSVHQLHALLEQQL